MLNNIIHFFENPFFIIIKGCVTLIMIGGFIYIAYLAIRGILPVLYSLGMGLATSKIAIFASTEYDSLKSMLARNDSNNPLFSKIVDPGNSTNILSDLLTREEKSKLIIKASIAVRQPRWERIIWQNMLYKIAQHGEEIYCDIRRN